MKKLLTLLLALACITSLSAQHISISGKITDNNKEVLTGASVAIYRQDSILQGGVTTNHQGVFKLKNIPAGGYKLVVSYVGFAAENIRLPHLQKDIDLGVISLVADTELDEVVVTGSNKRYEVSRQY